MFATLLMRSANEMWREFCNLIMCCNFKELYYQVEYCEGTKTFSDLQNILLGKSFSSSFSLLIFITSLLYVKIFYANFIPLAELDLTFKIYNIISGIFFMLSFFLSMSVLNSMVQNSGRAICVYF